MSANRRLQGEIDRCLKKVNEGVEKFEEIWQKVHHASNSNQKEKYEEDLKKEIKKLQRLRDQIKTWIASGSINDKSVLVEKRKLIEQQMERFKVVERETKTKAYSKEGLIVGAKLDPVEKERAETSDWLNQCIDTLNVQVDQFEAELESLSSSSKKKKSRDHADQVEEYANLLERHRYHVQKLETLLRMLDNDNVDIDQIKDIKDSVEYYIENCREPGFMEDEGVYDDIKGLDDMMLDVTNSGSPALPTSSSTSSKSSAALPLTAASTTSTATAQSILNSSSAPKSSSTASASAAAAAAAAAAAVSSSSSMVISSNQHFSSSSAAAAATAVPSSKFVNANNASPSSGVKNNGASEAGKFVNANNASPSSGVKNNGASEAGPPNFAAAVQLNGHASGTTLPEMSSSPSNGTADLTPSTTPSTPLAFSQVAATRAALSNSSTAAKVAGSNSSSSTSSGSGGGATNNTPGGTATDVSSLKAMAQQVVVAANSSSNKENEGSSQINNQQLASLGGANTTTTITSLNQQGLYSGDVSRVGTTRAQPSTSTPAVAVPSSTPSPSAAAAAVAAGTGSGNSNSEATGEAHIPPLLGVAPLGHVPLTKETRFQYAMLEAAFAHMPHPSDSERLRPYLPRNPCPTPVYYPQLPPAGSDSLDFFQKLSTETLFFIFYYMEGTKAQFLAAKALKKQSWRFHTKYMMWFQRHEEPKVINDEFEQGTYIYFDFEKWGQRKKEGFMFEYRFLEDRDLN